MIAFMEFGPELVQIDDGFVGDGPSTAEAIASPLPFKFWNRELLVGERGRWVMEKCSTYDDCTATSVTTKLCNFPDLSHARQFNPQLDAFLFWSRAPFAERAPDGSVVLRDARFYDPRARDRFSVALPDVKCEELSAN